MFKTLKAYSLDSPGSQFFQQYLNPSMSHLTQQCSANLVETFISSLANIEKITIIMYVI
jgi:TorA maturation chaperone TorD